MKTFFTGALLCAMVLLACLFYIPTKRSAPKTIVKSRGHVSGEIASIAFYLEPKSDITIRDHKGSCGCMELTLDGKPPELPLLIESGERREFQIDISTAGRIGTHRYGLILTGVSETQEWQREYVFELDIEKAWTLDPAGFHFKDRKPGEIIVRKFTVHRHSLGDQTRLTDIEVSDKSRVEVSLERPIRVDQRGKPHSSTEERQHEYHLSLRYTVPLYSKTDFVQLTGANGLFYFSLPVSCEVKVDTLRVKPDTLYFMNDGHSSKRVVWIYHRGDAVIEADHVPKGVSVRVLQDPQADRTKLIVHVHEFPLATKSILLKAGDERVTVNLRTLPSATSRADGGLLVK